MKFIPDFSAECSLSPTNNRYYGGGTYVQQVAGVYPAQGIAVDACVFGPNIRVGWQSFHDNRNGVVIVSGGNFPPRRTLQVRFDNCSSAFPERVSTTTNACGEFTLWHPCTCGGPAITVEARDQSGNSADGTVVQTC